MCTPHLPTAPSVPPVPSPHPFFDTPPRCLINPPSFMKPAATAKPKAKYRRILLKLSGEALGGEKGSGISPEAIHDMAQQIREVRELGVEIVIVMGGGNIFRGSAGSLGGIEPTTRNYIPTPPPPLNPPPFHNTFKQ